MNSNSHAGRRVTSALAGLIAVASMLAVLAISGTGEGHAATEHQHSHAMEAPVQTRKQLAFHDEMRKLWEQHVTWTRLAIVSFAGNLPDLPFTERRLLANQTDIGNAIKPFYGRAAGDQLTKLLKAHITGAVAVLEAAKVGDNARLAHAQAAWYANANQISDFLSAANPHHWPDAVMRAMMRTHLDQTLAEGADQLTARYAAGVRAYGAIEHHILGMADMLSSGIIQQFPSRFR